MWPKVTSIEIFSLDVGVSSFFFTAGERFDGSLRRGLRNALRLDEHFGFQIRKR
jgi:hypothetical protein